MGMGKQKAWQMGRPRTLGFLLLGGVVLWVGTGGISAFLANQRWFAEVGYGDVFWTRLWIQGGSGVLVTMVSALLLLGNLRLADRLCDRPGSSPLSGARLSSGVRSGRLSLRGLLPLTLGLGCLISGMGWHYGHWAVQAITQFQMALPDPGSRAGSLFTLPGLGLSFALAIALLVYPRVLLGAIALGLSLSFGGILAVHWHQILLALHAVPFEQADPVFGQDIGFYIFTFPLWELLNRWLLGLTLYLLLAVSLTYLLAPNSLSNGNFPGFSSDQACHLSGLSGGFMLSLALSHWLHRYALLYSSRGVTYGASYIDVQVELPVYTGLSGLAVAIALYCLRCTLAPAHRRSLLPRKIQNANRLTLQPVAPQTFPQAVFPQTVILRPIVCILLFLLLTGLTTGVLPAALQRLLVQPNEFAKERPYIQRSIDFTRAAFGLTSIVPQLFAPQNTLTANDLRTNELTVRNIRLWDTRPLLETNRQLQQIRPYYRFFDADIDRYLLGSPTAPEKRQVLISARELDYAAVPPEAQTWVNEHLVYTHGYGFTMSPVNTVVEGGLPDYFVKDIGGSLHDPTGNLKTANAQIRARIPTVHPRLYFGELTNTYVMTGSRVQELDYPSGDTNVYNVYDGNGGIAIASAWSRWIFARYLRDWRLLLSQDLTPQSRLLFRRNIQERIRAIAPFLQFDADPYLVVANTPETTPRSLYWIIDAYTTSDRYPYAAPSPSRPFNYIRNSVKVAIDAYSGSVNFYISDPTDPIIQAWTAIFPTLFQPLNAMPTALRQHIRYPIDLFTIQSERLITYHMTDPQVFYNREDLWQIPNEIYGTQTQPVEPYSLIMKLPTADTEEFVLLLPFTPNQRTNLTAWFAARSDGTAYGTSLLYLFPKQELIYGTEQIEARINQDPAISQQISLWNREGSRAVQGNLLVIPVNNSLLYVEPLYLEAQQNSLPTLVRVIVAYGNRIVMAETLEAGLDKIFGKAPKERVVAPALKSL